MQKHKQVTRLKSERTKTFTSLVACDSNRLVTSFTLFEQRSKQTYFKVLGPIDAIRLLFDELLQRAIVASGFCAFVLLHHLKEKNKHD